MVGGVLVLGTLLGLPCGVVSAHPHSAVRSADGGQRLVRLLREGMARSFAFRRLVEALNASDVIVYVAFVESPKRRAYLMHKVTATTGRRYLRAAISIRMTDHEALPVLAHELQHAWEVAQSPDVRDAAGVTRLFARIGYPATLDGERTRETDAALQVQQRVRAELQSIPSCSSQR